jgi:glycosyltransferase involved in cell wall biosynthesis
VAGLGLEDLVDFRRFVQTQDICRILGSMLALLLPSTEEQFGNVIIEAMVMGVPVILSFNCDARDLLVLTG